MALALSIATSFLQLMFWRVTIAWFQKNNMFTERRMSLRNLVALGLGLLVCGMILIGDTVLDMSATDYIVSGSSPQDYSWVSHSPIRQIIDLLYGAVCAFGELLTIMATFTVQTFIEKEDK